MNEFNISTKIYFGENSLDKLKEITNKKVLIVCDKFIVESGMVKLVESKLDNCEVEIFSEIVPDPSVEIVALGVQKLRECKAQIIIALGGGSSIDGAKAINEYNKLLIGNEISIEEFYAIPTTSGTGSEVTEYAVITNKEEGLKYAIANKDLLPTVAILDSSLVKSVPKNITADTGMDVITHAIEAYVSINANDFSDALAEKALELAIEYLPRAYKNGDDSLAREKVHNASCLAGLAFNSAGLGITHSLAHAIGGKFHVSHGRSNAIILPYTIEFNANLSFNSYTKEFNVTAEKYKKLAKILGINSPNIIVAVNNLIKNISKLKVDLGIPITFKEQGIDIKLILENKDEIINAALKDICTKSNPRAVKYEDLECILNKISGIK